MLDLRVSGVGRIDLHVGRSISQRVRLCVSGLFEQEWGCDRIFSENENLIGCTGLLPSSPYSLLGRARNTGKVMISLSPKILGRSGPLGVGSAGSHLKNLRS